MLGGGKTEEILAAIPVDAGTREGSKGEEPKDDLGMQNVMADLSLALKDNKPRAAADAFKRAIQIAMLDME